MRPREDNKNKESLVISAYWVLLVVFWFATLGQRALIHPDEGRYAELSLSMLQSGDWITPRLNGILYFEKPALQYWMGALSFLTFGINEFAARFWPALTGILSVATIALTARRLWGHGHYAALAMAGSFWVIGNSHFLTLDAGLMFFLTLTLCAFLWAQHDDASLRERRYGMWLAWAATAGAVLSKGLVGVLIPGCTLILYSAISNHWNLWRRLTWKSGLALFLALATPWFWLVSQRNPGFMSFFFVHEHLDRYLTNEAQREGPLWYFVPFLLAGFLPWTSLLPRLVGEAWPHKRELAFQPERFLLIWAGFVFAFFSLSHSKLPSYILPMFPALALLLGQTLARAKAASLRRHLWIPVIAWAVITGLYPMAGLFSSPDTPLPIMQHFARYLAFGGAGFLLCAGLAWYSLSKGITLYAIMLLTAGSLWGVSIASIGHDALGQLKSSKALVAWVKPYIHPQTDVFAIRGAYDQTLPFYLRRPVIQVDYRGEFEFGQQAEPAKASLTIDEFSQRWDNSVDAMALMDHDTFDNFNQQGLRMKTVYRNARRIVVVKP